MGRGCNKFRLIQFTLVCGGFLVIMLSFTWLSHCLSRREERFRESKLQHKMGQASFIGQKTPKILKIVCNVDRNKSDQNQLKWKLTDLVCKKFEPECLFLCLAKKKKKDFRRFANFRSVVILCWSN